MYHSGAVPLHLWLQQFHAVGNLVGQDYTTSALPHFFNTILPTHRKLVCQGCTTPVGGENIKKSSKNSMQLESETVRDVPLQYSCTLGATFPAYRKVECQGCTAGGGRGPSLPSLTHTQNLQQNIPNIEFLYFCSLIVS